MFKWGPIKLLESNKENFNFQDLKSIAFMILTIPSSTSSVERVFSAAEIVSLGRKNRLSDDRLEMIVFLKTNSKYLKCLSSW